MEQILQLLEKDGRLGAAEIAERTGRDPEEVKALIAEAEDRGIIRGYGARVNWEAQGLSTVYALVEVTVEPQENVGYNAIARRIARFDEVRTAYFVSGAYDLLVIVEGESMHAVSDFVGDKLATMPGVKGTVTHVLMRRYKEDGVMLEELDEADRQAVVF